MLNVRECLVAPDQLPDAMMQRADEQFLVTGALGCIGAWTVRALVREGVPVVAFDLGRNHRRLDQIMSDADSAPAMASCIARRCSATSATATTPRATSQKTVATGLVNVGCRPWREEGGMPKS